MRIFIFLVLLLSLFACQKGQTVHSKWGQYSLQFPAPADSILQKDVEAYFYKSPDSIWEYQAACMQLSKEQQALSSDSLFEALLLGAALRLKPLSIQREEGPWPQKSKRYTLLGFDAAAVYELYRKEDKVYQLLIVNKQPQEVGPKEIEAFMGSFSLKEE
ncbi:hypothetical protein [Saprospira grandis]|uniref:Lipoprotein n=1 Tax=Saprospira grandis (strain Lewin) TaxID=984262 RepID=H6L5B2_SAPGL|nr:hypothetical protein [Saprospira grandis]AFC24026.1 hypothetical protein SGRA_1291 [Saprospira grandis str. Lewin]